MAPVTKPKNTQKYLEMKYQTPKVVKVSEFQETMKISVCPSPPRGL